MAQWTQRELLEAQMPPALAQMVDSGRLVHALCLEGDPQDRRLTALAHALAGAVLCRRQQGRMCGECLDCRKVLEGVHSDLFVGGGTAAAYKKEAIRQLRQQAWQSPSEGRGKVFILPNAQLISVECQNLLLKLIEEPPEETLFLLLCPNRYQLLPTILSRVVTVALPPLDTQQCAQQLRQLAPGLREEEYRQAALLSGGSPGRGLCLLTDEGEKKQGQALWQLLDAMAAGDGYRLMVLMAPWEKDRAAYSSLLVSLSRLLGSREVGEEKNISLPRAMALRQWVDQTWERNEANGNTALLSAALAERLRR